MGRVSKRIREDPTVSSSTYRRCYACEAEEWRVCCNATVSGVNDEIRQYRLAVEVVFGEDSSAAHEDIVPLTWLY